MLKKKRNFPFNSQDMVEYCGDLVEDNEMCEVVTPTLTFWPVYSVHPSCQVIMTLSAAVFAEG